MYELMRRRGRLVGIAISVLAVSAAVSTAEKLPWVAGSETVVVLPDTQRYSQKYPKVFEAQTRWIADNYRKRNITYMLHLGDITQSDIHSEWKVAKHCITMLDGKTPYALAIGNHDYRGSRDKTLINEYFPPGKFEKWPTFGGVYKKGRIENHYHLTKIQGRKWIILSLEYGPRYAVLDWANKILTQHTDRLGMIVTHAYMFRNNVRYDHTKGKQRANPYGFDGEGSDGQEMWDKVVRKHPNMMIVISGHVRTGGPQGSYLASKGDRGNVVHQMMTDYQKLPSGGKGYLRLLEFLPDGKTVQVRTYSPVSKRLRKSKFEDFRFELKRIEGSALKI